MEKTHDRVSLTREMARLRSSQIISPVLYTLRIQFGRDSDMIDVTTTIDFGLKNMDAKEIFLDFAGSVISSLQINSVVLDQSEIQKIWVDYKLALSAKYLNKESNRVVITTKSPFSQKGYGVIKHEYRRMQIKIQSIYTLFPTNYAHTAFPCFDQPDIKGRFQLRLVHCAEFIVESNESPTEFLDVSEFQDNSLWQETVFACTKPISTYLFGFIAGDYQCITNK